MNVTDYWNHNVAHHARIVAAVPEGCRAALDVGCGDGMLAAKLAARAKRVVGIDASAHMAAQARRRAERAGADIEIVEGEFLAAVRDGVLPKRSFDFVCSVATIHHLDFEPALRTMAELVAPGGRLVVVGLAMSRSVLDWVIAAGQIPVMRVIRLTHGGKGAPPGMPVRFDGIGSYAETKAATLRVLPDARWRRTLQIRYLVEWTAPQD